MFSNILVEVESSPDPEAMTDAIDLATERATAA
jgi:hypothetical protein